MPPVTWIFQGNPDRFNIQGYLAARLPRITWTVKRYADKMAVGDEVFLWCTAGGAPRKDTPKSGILALAHIVSAPWEGPDHRESQEYWQDSSDANAPETRVFLTVNRVATTKGIIQREWLIKDPVCRELPILKQSVGTNFPVPPEMATRLHALWSRTGEDWTRAESLAALRVYEQIRGASISITNGSPVAELALLVGRVIGGAYNKVLNFRALDSRDSRKGLDGVGAVDRTLWAEFFDPVTKTVRMGDLEAEFQRLWPATTGGPDTHQYAEEFQRLVRRNSARTLAQLSTDYAARGPKPRPLVTRVTSTVFDRDERVIAIARHRAGNRCEVPGCHYEPFITTYGENYVEVHHIETLANGGADTPDNVACLCPAHHREIHFGLKARQLREALRRVRCDGAL